MALSISILIVALVTFWSQITPIFSGLVVDEFQGIEDVVVFTKTPSKYKHFGRNTGKLEGVEIVTIQPQDYADWCEKLEIVSNKEYYEGKVVILHEEFDMQCAGRLGSVIDFDSFLPFWCSLNASAIFRLNEVLYPGLMANENDGKYFRDILAADPDLSDCLIVQSMLLDPDTLKQDQIARNFYNSLRYLDNSSVIMRGNLVIDWNDALDILESPIVHFVFKGLLSGCYFMTSFLAAYYLLLRMRLRLQSDFVHRLILTMNAVVAFLLGSLEAYGNKFIDDYLPNTIVVATYTSFFATSAAADFFVAIAYRQARRLVLNSKQKTIIKGRFLLGSAFLLLFTEVFFTIALVNTTGSTYNLMAMGIPALCLVMQLFVVVLLLKETFQMVRLLKNNGISPDERVSLSPAQQYVLHCKRILEKRIRFWCQVSAFIAFSLTVSYIFFLNKFYEKHPKRWVIFWAIYSCMKCANMFAQVSVCKPPPNFEKIKTKFIQKQMKRLSSDE